MHRARRLLRPRRGFAIPFALMLIALLTIGVATTYKRVQVEKRADQDRQGKTDAFNYAQEGIERYTIERKALGFTSNPPAVAESAKFTMPAGSVNVVLRLVKPKTLTRAAVYLLKARGFRSMGSMAWSPVSQQTVSQLVIWREGSMNVIAGWSSLSGIKKAGGAGTMTGNDGCGVMPTVAGVAVPTGEYTQSGGGLVPSGSPDVLDMGTQTASNDSIKIDWDGIVNGNSWPADITIPPDAWPSSFPPGWWPVIRVNGNLSLPSSGRGTLIITGDLTLGGSLTWDGIILVGGIITSNGTNNIQGATVSGLNEKLGISVGVSDVANGTKTFQYNSCNILSALQNSSKLQVMSKTWSDNWPTW